MNADFTKKIYDIDPTFFKHAINCVNGKEDATDTCMFWGLECGDGWFKPLERFVNKVKIVNDELKKYNSMINCDQLKEKYAELRVYYSINKIDENKEDIKDSKIDYLIDIFEDALKKAEDDCWNVCEWCGAEGGYKGENLIVTSGWLSRICKNCAKDKDEKAIKKHDEYYNKVYIPRITNFNDAYYFLSLFHIDGFKYKEKYYNSIIEAFYSIKDKEHIKIYNKIGSETELYKSPYLINEIANAFGYCYEDNENDYNLLKEIVLAKFSYEFNSDIKQELIDTDNKLLQNKGFHHNNILGYCTCDNCKNKEHKDLYAKILMEVREILSMKEDKKECK